MTLPTGPLRRVPRPISQRRQKPRRDPLSRTQERRRGWKPPAVRGRAVNEFDAFRNEAGDEAAEATDEAPQLF